MSMVASEIQSRPAIKPVRRLANLLRTLWMALTLLIPFNTVIQNSTIHAALYILLGLSIFFIVYALQSMNRIPFLVLLLVLVNVVLPIIFAIKSPYIIAIILLGGVSIAISTDQGWYETLRHFMVIAAIISLLEYAIKSPVWWESRLGLQHIYYDGIVLRARGTLGHPLVMGTVFAGFLASELARFPISTPKRRRRYLEIGLITCAIISTRSLTPFIVVPLSLLVVWFQRRFPKDLQRKFIRILSIGILLGLTLVFGVTLFKPSNVLSISSVRISLTNNVSQRFEHALVGHQLLASNPCENVSCNVLGHGYRALQVQLKGSEALGGLSTVDNQFATSFYDGGWVGLTTCIWLWIFVIRRRSKSRVAISCACGSLALLFCFFSFDVLYNYASLALLGLFLGGTTIGLDEDWR